MSISNQLTKNAFMDRDDQLELNHQSTPVHILLVDDNPTNLKVLSDVLQGQGWKTLMAIDGESAIEQAEYAHPDIILLDIMMPNMDGFETCQKLKAIAATNDIPIIFMTALSDSANKVKGLELGAVDYITKPFQQEEVIARIKLQVKLFQLTHALEEQNTLLQKKIVEQTETEAALQHLTQELEQRVQARTRELTESLEKLNTTQLQLVQSEKMSTLGQLVAGVGHEINNPIGFLSGNLLHIEEYTKDLIRLLNLYQKKLLHSDSDIAALVEDVDPEYLVEDLPKLIKSMHEGINRLRDISLSLRTFARSDTTAKVAFQVHEGIDSTLMLLKHRLKANDKHPEIAIVKQYGGLPPINCYPGQLNQVFMNLIANAIDALEDFNQNRSYQEIEGNPNRITIQTIANVSSNSVTIRIQDNGIGIPSEIQTMIFEPTFTTKSVGKGTGLGLPISRQIIEDKHSGKLSCFSTPGEGTEFVLTLPS